MEATATPKFVATADDVRIGQRIYLGHGRAVVTSIKGLPHGFVCIGYRSARGTAETMTLGCTALVAIRPFSYIDKTGPEPVTVTVS